MDRRLLPSGATLRARCIPIILLSIISQSRNACRDGGGVTNSVSPWADEEYLLGFITTGTNVSVVISQNAYVKKKK